MFRVISLRKNEKGQSAVEFALILPVLLILILGMIEFGWLLNGQITLNSAAREGARVGAVVTTDRPEKVDQAVKETADLSGLTILSTDVDTVDDPEINKYNIVVTVNGRMTPIIGIFVSGDVEMDSIATMRRE